jgi:hypothetical protein
MTPARMSVSRASCRTGRWFEPLGAEALGQAQDAEAGAIALLGMRPVGEDRLDERGRLGTDGARPVDEARRRPLEVALVGLGHVGGIGGVVPADKTPPMRGDTLAAVEDLDGGGGQTRDDVFVDERVGDGVVMAVEFDVVVDADARADPPVAVDEGLGGERAERGQVQPLEELAPAGAVETHRSRVEIRQQLRDAGVEGGSVAIPPPFGGGRPRPTVPRRYPSASALITMLRSW